MNRLTPIFAAATLLLAPRPTVDWTALSGRWEGSGTFQGQPATGRIHWEGVLGGKFKRLGIALSLDSTVIFEGHAYYDLRPGEPIRGSWFDSQGSSYPIRATMEGDSLVAFWGMDPSAPTGRSVYHLTGEKLLVTDYRARDREWRPFARLEYRKAGS